LVTSKLLRTEATQASPPQLHRGHKDHDFWFPALFGPDRSAFPVNSLAFRTTRARQDILPEAMEILRVSPILPPGHIGRNFCSGPPLSLSGYSPDPTHMGRRTVHVQLHCHFRSLPDSFSNESRSASLRSRPSPSHRFQKSLLCFNAFCGSFALAFGTALGMALASIYAISGLSQGELCSTTHGLEFRDAPITFFLSWSVFPRISSSTAGFDRTCPRRPCSSFHSTRILDTKRVEAQLARD